MNDHAKKLLPYLDNPNVLAYLDTIADAEGAVHGYRTEFGGGELADLSKHPNKLRAFTTTTGQKSKTSAAGRYQINKATYEDFAPELGITDFAPVSQDLIALAIMEREGVLDDVAEGRFEQATAGLGNRWASLPSSQYDQPTRSESYFASHLADNLAQRLGQAAVQKREQLQARPEQPSSTPSEMLAQLFVPEQTLPPAPPMPEQANPQPARASNVAAPPRPMDLDFIRTIAQDGTPIPMPGGPAPEIMTERDFQEAVLSTRTPSESGDTPSMRDPRNAPGVRPAPEGPPVSASSTPRQTLDDLVDQMMGGAISDDGDSVRRETLARFLGDDVVPDFKMPKAIERAINKVAAVL